MFSVKIKHALYLILFLLFVVLLFGCSKESVPNSLPQSLHNIELKKKEIPLSFIGGKVMLPIKEMKGSFSSGSGWLDNQTILYVTDTSDGSALYSYDLVVGQSTLLYSSVYPIVSVTVSPTRSSILIHSSPNSSTGLVTIISSSGKIILSSEIPSNELAIEWNEYNENLLLISSFTEDWQYQTYTLDISNNTLAQIIIPQPFAYWSNVNELLYLDWRTDRPSLSAPLKKYNINSKVSKDVLEDVYQVDIFSEHTLSITIDSSEESTVGNYTFYDQNFQVKSRLLLPQLSNFSGWSVPFYDFNKASHTFYTFKPEYSSEIDTYKGTFDLIKFSIESNEELVVIEDLVNEPISCSPNGTLCLYGYSLENLLLLGEKKKIGLIEE
ncbi:YqgU-like beta propeller domain-containing protein [Robertmurraya sp. GLU-23]